VLIVIRRIVVWLYSSMILHGLTFFDLPSDQSMYRSWSYLLISWFKERRVALLVERLVLSLVVILTMPLVEKYWHNITISEKRGVCFA
jgi:hypothetical protein